METREFAFAAALLAGIAIGWIGGRFSEPAAVMMPANYDPTRAVVADALKEQIGATERCWKTALAAVAKGGTAQEP